MNMQELIARMNAALKAAYDARSAERITAERKRTERIVSEYRTQQIASEAADALHAIATYAARERA